MLSLYSLQVWTWCSCGYMHRQWRHI